MAALLYLSVGSHGQNTFIVKHVEMGASSFFVELLVKTSLYRQSLARHVKTIPLSRKRKGDA
jgi:hypothetical protein